MIKTKYQYGGYGIYYDEMHRLDQIGMVSKFRNRKLEGLNNDDKTRHDSISRPAVRNIKRIIRTRKD